MRIGFWKAIAACVPLLVAMGPAHAQRVDVDNGWNGSYISTVGAAKSDFYALNIDKFGVHNSVEIFVRPLPVRSCALTRRPQDPSENKKEVLRMETLADGPT